MFGKIGWHSTSTGAKGVNLSGEVRERTSEGIQRNTRTGGNILLSKSRITWLKCKNKNTRNFHLSAINKRVIGTIFTLKDREDTCQNNKHHYAGSF